MLDHLVVGIVDLDPPVLVFVSCPLELGGFATADCNDAGARYAAEEGSYMAFAHAAETCDGDGDMHVLLGRHSEIFKFVDDVVEEKT
jgi:hypothetical protein